jgi:hypothetical protein
MGNKLSYHYGPGVGQEICDVNSIPHATQIVVALRKAGERQNLG